MMKTLKNARYAIPNGITAANVVCGFSAILASMENQFVLAAWLIIAAGIFDLFDGRVARMVNATSRFGEEFDTLSDFLSFGVAPAVLSYQFYFRPIGPIGATISIIYLLCVAFRLARFTLTIGKTAAGFFQGLSSPPSACVVATSVMFTVTASAQGLIPEVALQKLAPFLMIFLAALMVSHLRFPSFKNTKWKSPVGAMTLVTLAALIFIALANPKLYLFPILLGLLGLVVVADLSYRVRHMMGLHSQTEAPSQL